MKCPTCGLDREDHLCPDPYHRALFTCHHCKLTTEVTTVGSLDLCHVCLISYVAALKADLAEAVALLSSNQWVHHDFVSEEDNWCPQCWHEEKEGHGAGCRTDAFLSSYPQITEGVE